MSEKQGFEQHHTGLTRRLGLFTAITLVISQMIGSGVFKKIAPMSAELHNPGWVLLAWLVAGLITLAGALTNAEIAGIIAAPGGQYSYFKKMYGKAFAFFFGWASFAVIQSATVAGVAYVFAMSVNTLIPLPQASAELASWSIGGVFYPFDNLGVKVVTIGLITLLTLVNYRGIQWGGLVSNLIASCIVTAIVSIVLLGISLSEGSTTNLSTASSSFPASLETNAGFFSAFFTAMMGAFWAYEGWNNLGYLGGEIKNPHRNIPLALVFGVGAVVLVYLAINATYLYILPIDRLIAINSQENQIAAVVAVQEFMGQGGVYFITSLILIATLGSTNGVILTASRLYFAMAHDRLFFRQAKNVHQRFKTPGVSLLLQGLWASVLVLSGSFDQLTDMLVFAAFLFYGAMALGVFVLRFKLPQVPRPYKAFGYPWIPALFVLFCAGLVGVSLMEKPRECIIGLVLIASGLPFFLYWRKNFEDRD